MRKITVPVLALLILIFVIGCGASTNYNTGPGPELTVSGTAAAGAPIIGYAYLKDSAGTTLGPTEINGDGTFSFTVTDLTAPFYLRASGMVGVQAYDLYSVSVQDGTANINPLTSVAVAAAASVSDPEDVWDDPKMNPITQSNLTQAITDIKALIQPLLDAYSATTDFHSGDYNADHTGLDAVLDIVSVEIDTDLGTVTITDRIAGETIGAADTDDLANPTDAISTDEADQSTQTETDLVEIAAMLSALATVMNTGISLTANDIDDYFSATFGIEDGMDRTMIINDMVLAGQAFGLLNVTISSISSLSILGLTDGGHYKIHFIIHLSDGTLEKPFEYMVVASENNSWVFKGNGFYSRLELAASAVKWVKTDGSTKTATGLMIDIEDPGAEGLFTAIITGPGLPAEGVSLTQNEDDVADMDLDDEFQDSTLPDFNSSFYVITDTVIPLMVNNSEYTIKLYDDEETLVETRTRTLPKSPLVSTAILSAHFPTFTGLATHDLADANIGGTLNFTYALPTAYDAYALQAWLDYHSSEGDWAQTEKMLLLDQTSAGIITLTPQWTPTAAAFSVWAVDTYNREFTTIWMFD